jgi:hypothetical protein
VREAEVPAGNALAWLQTRAHTDFDAYVWLGLAHYVSGEVDRVLGDGGGAARHFDKEARIAPRCWFGHAP